MQSNFKIGPDFKTPVVWARLNMYWPLTFTLPPPLTKHCGDHIFVSFPFLHCDPMLAFLWLFLRLCQLRLTQLCQAPTQHCWFMAFSYSVQALHYNYQCNYLIHSILALCLNILRHLISHSLKPPVSMESYCIASLSCARRMRLKQRHDLETQNE